MLETDHGNRLNCCLGEVNVCYLVPGTSCYNLNCTPMRCWNNDLSNHAVSVFRLPATLARVCLALTIEHPGPAIRDLEAKILVCVWTSYCLGSSQHVMLARQMLFVRCSPFVSIPLAALPRRSQSLWLVMQYHGWQSKYNVQRVVHEHYHFLWTVMLLLIESINSDHNMLKIHVTCNVTCASRAFYKLSVHRAAILLSFN